MPQTTISDVVVPEVFAPYLMEPILVKNALIDSGIVAYDALLASKLDVGGDIFQFPYWGALDLDTTEVPTEAGANTVNKITTDKLNVPRQFRSYTAGATKLASILAGSNAMEAIQMRVVDVWKKSMQTTLVKTLAGILNTTGGAGVVEDVAAAAGVDPDVSNNVSAEAFVDAMSKLGDQGSGFEAMVIHSAPYAELQKLELIDYIQPSNTAEQIATYKGMRVIVDDGTYKFTRTSATLGDQTVYTTFLIKGAAFKYGDSDKGFTPVHIEVDETAGIGTETLFTRKMFALHPMGFDFTSASVAGDLGPTDAELAADANWALKYGVNTMGFVAVYSNAV